MCYGFSSVMVRKSDFRQLRKSVLHEICMNIQTASAPGTSNIHPYFPGLQHTKKATVVKTVAFSDAGEGT